LKIHSRAIRIIKAETISIHAAAPDGIEALHVLRNAPAGVDLLLSDVRMPRMDGVALARVVRAEFPAIPLILVSGFCTGEQAPDLDVHFLPKPFTPAGLIAAIGSAMTPKEGAALRDSAQHPQEHDGGRLRRERSEGRSYRGLCHCDPQSPR
jgi:YesN/AraC family two-component response regulator